VARLAASAGTREEEVFIARAATIKLFGRVWLARDATVIVSIGTGFTGWMASHAVTIAAHECTLAAEARPDITAVKERFVLAACAVGYQSRPASIASLMAARNYALALTIENESWLADTGTLCDREI